MGVLINFKICDNCADCNAIKVCPTGAFRWNEEKKTLEIDKDKCIDCGICATSPDSCQVGAIRFGKTLEELEKIQKEIEEDKRTIKDLMVDRYGGQPINLPFSCNENEIEEIINTSKICFLEVYNDDSIECLIKSIPIKEIMKEVDYNFVYRKVKVESKEFMDKYNIITLPSILFFKDKKCIGKIDGYYSENEKQELIDKIKDIIRTT